MIMQRQVASASSRPDNPSKDLLSWHEVDAVYREPFILTGYRRPGISSYQCLQYTLVAHNEVGNFWTHFIPFIGWLVWLFYLAMSWEDFFQPYHYPLICFWIGACSYALFSSIAHLFSCKSFVIRTICFILDYQGIAMYALGGAISSLFYMSPNTSPCFSYKVPILVIEVCLAVMATFLSGLSRFFWTHYRFLIRVSAYVFPYLCSLGPYLHRQYLCILHGTHCIPEMVSWHILDISFTIALTFFFVTKIPERLLPGQFDYLFQSHQIFHVCSAGLTTVQMYYIPLELHLRRAELSRVEGAMPNWETTFLPLVFGEVLGLLVVGVLGYLTWNKTLATNKVDKSE